MAPTMPLSIQVDPTAKHPALRLTPPAKVLVAVPVMAKLVVVAAVVVDLVAVKFCKVLEAYVMRF
jgi:hypothetical protein